jgi:hypothetical protein
VRWRAVAVPDVAAGRCTPVNRADTIWRTSSGACAHSGYTTCPPLNSNTVVTYVLRNPTSTLALSDLTDHNGETFRLHLGLEG